MNGLRITRKYIASLTDKDLVNMWEVAEVDSSYEAVVITHYIQAELERRKMVTYSTKKDPYTEAVYNLYIKGMITEQEFIEKLKK